MDNDSIYRRVGRGIWEQSYGESWETVLNYDHERELEKLFSDYMRSTPLLINIE